MDAITTAYLWYLGPERDDAMFAAYAATYPKDVHEGLHVLREGGVWALACYVEKTLDQLPS
jgi:hypothetical protein